MRPLPVASHARQDRRIKAGDLTQLWPHDLRGSADDVSQRGGFIHAQPVRLGRLRWEPRLPARQGVFLFSKWASALAFVTQRDYREAWKASLPRLKSGAPTVFGWIDV